MDYLGPVSPKIHEVKEKNINLSVMNAGSHNFINKYSKENKVKGPDKIILDIMEKIDFTKLNSQVEVRKLYSELTNLATQTKNQKVSEEVQNYLLHTLNLITALPNVESLKHVTFEDNNKESSKTSFSSPTSSPTSSKNVMDKNSNIKPGIKKVEKEIESISEEENEDIPKDSKREISNQMNRNSVQPEQQEKIEKSNSDTETKVIKSKKELEIKSLKNLPPKLNGLYSKVNSTKLYDSNGKKDREDFKNDKNYTTQPLIISSSPFVPPKMIDHLYKDKKDLAIGVKFELGDKITNMEGALHTFVTPIVNIKMTGDYKFADGAHGAVDLEGNCRNVILSAAIHPDFERDNEREVVMKLVEVTQNSVEGKEMDPHLEPLEDTSDKEKLINHENKIRCGIVYHITAKHRLPSLSEVSDDKILMPKVALDELENVINNKSSQNISTLLIDKFVRLNNHVISLEALYNIYVEQIRNEFSVLEATLTQGYVYTIDPPSIFAVHIGKANVNILNRLQLLAIKQVNSESKLKNLKILGFNNYADKKMVDLYAAILPKQKVVPKAELFKGPNGEYSIKKKYALVEHNNSDAFGQNIEFEGATSKDGVIGVRSTACLELDRRRKDGIKV